MSESHGTTLRLKRHEDLEKVAAYVKQQVREKSLKLLGKDLSEDNEYVKIDEDNDNIIWHDYEHHGDHLDFYPIEESVIKEFPEVKMELTARWGSEVWNYVIVDGKWLEVCPWIATEMMMCGDTAKNFILIEPTDKEWLMQMAVERKDIGAIYCLLRGMHHKYNYWKDTFVDEDTNEEVECLRCDIVEGSTFEKNEGEEERLVQIVMEQKHRLGVDELSRLCCEIADNKELLLERIKKGNEEAAIYIDDLALLQELCDKGNQWAAYALYQKYDGGDEKRGVFINKERARKYYDLAGDIPYKEEWDDTDDPGEEFPCTYQ